MKKKIEFEIDEDTLGNEGLSNNIRQMLQGKQVEVQHLTNYCKQNGITIFALMRKYKDTYPGVRGFKVISKLGWNNA